MPRIIQNKGDGKIIWDKDDWDNGLAYNWTTSIFPVVLGGNRLTSSSAMDPFRKWGVPLPGHRPANATNNSVVTEFLRKGIVKETNAYIVSNGAKLQQFNGIATLTNNAVFPHTITAHGGHATPIGNDCVAYTSKLGGTSALRYFYSWSDNTDWDVGIYDFVSTFDDDFMSTVPATPLSPTGSGFPHPLIVGDDDVLYMGDRNNLHAYDGQVGNDGKFYDSVLPLPNGWIITSMEKVESGLMIFAYYSSPTNNSNDNYRGQARAFLWNYNELDITRSYNLNDNFTSESFTVGTTVGVFTTGRIADQQTLTKKSKMQLFDGEKFVPTVSFPGSAPIRGGVEVSNESVTWNSDGNIYVYGSKILGEKAGLHKIAHSVNGQTSGMLSTFFDSNNILSVSSGTTTNGGLETFSTNYEGTSSLSNCFLLTALAEPLFPFGYKGRITKITMLFSNTVNPVNTTEFTLRVCDRMNNQQTILDAYTDVTSSENSLVKRTLDSSDSALMEFDGLALLFGWTRQSGIATESFGPVRVEADYEIIQYT